MNVISTVPRAHRAVHYMSAMGLWWPPGGLGAPILTFLLWPEFGHVDIVVNACHAIPLPIFRGPL